MLSLTTIVISTTDIPSIPPGNQSHFPREWQTALMDHFFEPISPEGKLENSNANTLNDYCEWNGIKCDAGVVSAVQYRFSIYGNFNVHALPSAVKHIDINQSWQQYALQTKALPRNLQYCTLSVNNLFGSVNLRMLPAKLRRLDLSSNKLTGPIDSPVCHVNLNGSIFFPTVLSNQWFSTTASR